jgi:hypothetical protein
MKNLAVTSFVLLAFVGALGCASPTRPSSDAVEQSDVLPLGGQYECELGSLFVIRVQDEYRLIRSVPRGSIAGYDDVFVVPRDQVRWNRWVTVPGARGLELAIVSPERVAFRCRTEPGTPR